MRFSLLISALLLTTPLAWADQDECKYEKALDARLGAPDGLRVDAGSGQLRVIGKAGIDQVTVQGRACASSQKLLDQIELDTSDGGSARIETILPEMVGSWLGGRRYAALHLTVTVPERLALELRDSSGSITISNSGPLDLVDSSGSISVNGINGDLRLRDGSGSIDVHDVEGTVTIEEDGSGSIEVTRVAGDVRIGRDGSGSIEIKEVQGSVEIGNDGSGGIVVERVAGNFSVGDDGSGGIDYAAIEGELDLPRDKRKRKYH